MNFFKVFSPCRHALALFFGFSLSSATASICFIPHDDASEWSPWSFEMGVAFITSNNIEQLITGDITIADNAAGGEIYSFTGSRRLGELQWEAFGRTFRPELEVPLTLSIIDENGRGAFLDYSASFVVRWVDFPWNGRVSTTLSMGVGLSYSDQVYLMDIQRHPGNYRSHLNFNWPIQLTFALPEHPERQFMLYLMHHSGGRIFDRGGTNALGVGCRLEF